MGAARIHRAAVAVVLAACMALSLVSNANAAAEKGQDMGMEYWSPATSGCKGSIAECMGKDEYGMDTEVNRRILAIADNIISYRALDANRVPCSVAGASYYNCQPGAQANPQTRGCSAISLCRTS